MSDDTKTGYDSEHEHEKLKRFHLQNPDSVM